MTTDDTLIPENPEQARLLFQVINFFEVQFGLPPGSATLIEHDVWTLRAGGQFLLDISPTFGANTVSIQLWSPHADSMPWSVRRRLPILRTIRKSPEESRGIRDVLVEIGSLRTHLMNMCPVYPSGTRLDDDDDDDDGLLPVGFGADVDDDVV